MLGETFTEHDDAEQLQVMNVAQQPLGYQLQQQVLADFKNSFQQERSCKSSNYLVLGQTNITEASKVQHRNLLC